MRHLALFILLACTAALPGHLAAGDPAEPTPWPVTTAVFQYAAPVPADPTAYKVGKDETVALIARKILGAEARAPEILALNPGLDPATLKVGDSLRVPGKTGSVYLWIPPAAERVRGVLIGGSVLAEPAIATHPAIRAACAEAQLAIVYFSPHPDATFDATRTGPKLLQALADLAKVSGRSELAVAPWLPFGHSVGTIWTRNVLFWKPERAFGAIFFKGGFGVPEGHAIGEILGIPLCHIQGRFEEFGPGPSGVLRKDLGEDRSTGGKTAMKQLGEWRAKEPRFLMGLFVEDGATHYALSDRVAARIAGYLGAAAKRIPAWPVEAKEPPQLIAIDPASGAYSAGGDLFSPPAAPAAAVADYKGDPAQTFWHGTVALAQAADAFHAVAQGKQAQFVGFAGSEIQAHDLRWKIPPVWTGADTLRIAGVFKNSVQPWYPKVEGPVGHAEGPVRVRVFGGSLEQIGADTFRVSMDFRLGDRCHVLAYHPGDATYRFAEQHGNVRYPNRLDAGKAQAIAFPPLGTLKAGALPLKLQATSDSGLPVRFHVDHGPARVTDGSLELAEVPVTAAWPLTIEVVAWQYGSAIEPKVQSAEPVRQTVLIEK